MAKRTFSIISLGCFRNNYDSEIVAKRFEDRGFVFKDNPRNCHTLIINTCGFIDPAKKEAIGVIRQALDLKKKGRISKLLVFGCLVQRYGKDLERFFPQVDQWWGAEEFGNKVPLRKNISLLPAEFLKICEGCFNRCSFCAIPSIKGPLKSRPLNEVIKEAKLLDEKGIKELNIIGQDITSWGRDLKGRPHLTGLLKNILKATKKIRWIRLIYTHPRHFTQGLIDLIAQEERICKYIDLPIQHINNRILRLMNRKITKKDIISLIVKIRKIPDVVLRTSLIVGFPQESEEEFKELLKFMQEVKFERLGAFIYSQEENTPAAKYAQVHPSTKKRRFNQLMSLQKVIAAQANQRFIGKKLDVLVEAKNNDILIGRSQYDAPQVDGVVFLKKKNLKLNSFYRAEIVDAYDYDLVGV